MANKVTKKDNFNTLLSLEQVQANAALVAFINHEIELLDRKAENRSAKPTVRQAQNAEVKAEIVASMEKGKQYRCSEIQAMNATLSTATGTQRTARLCNDLVAEGLLVKSIDKKVVYFALAE